MTEYKVRKIANVVDVLTSWIFVILIGYIFALITKQDVRGWIAKCCIFGVFMDIFVLRKHLKRRIIVNPQSITFKSYHIDRAYRDAEIDFSAIERIGKCFSFNIKGTAMCLRVSGYEKDILVDATMENHKELFSEICKKAKEHNPDVKISKKIIDYISE